MKGKREARILALQAMYACDIRPDDEPATIFETLKEQSFCSGKMSQYARMLVDNALADYATIDSILQEFSENWDLERMAVIDRNILRLAITELRHSKDVSYKVVIDEAVEMAKTYGTDESGKFVNGVLDTVYKKKLKGK
jgi:N utilization substance protein B